MTDRDLNNKLAAAFPLPATEPAGDGDLELSPKALAAWLEALPYAMPERCAEMMLRTVRKNNRLCLSDGERRLFAAALDVPAHFLLETLHRKLQQAASPPLAAEGGNRSRSGKGPECDRSVPDPRRAADVDRIPIGR